jgi:hypothetical protein
LERLDKLIKVLFSCHMDLIGWLLSQGAKVRKGGQEYCINCPRCGDVRRHLYINPHLGVGHCFRCGYSGRVEEILVGGFGLRWEDVGRMLRGIERVDKRHVCKEEREEKVDFPEGSVGLGAVGLGVRYLVERWCEKDRVRFEDLVEMGCRWWNGRVVIPCWKDRGRKELWYWVARAIDEGVEPKYLNCASSKGDVVWGLDWYDVSDGYLYVCEGWKDAYRMKGIALLGSEMSEGQMQLIVKLVNELGVVVRVLLDFDAWRKAILVGKRLSGFLGRERVQVMFLVGLKDPGEGESKEEVEGKLVGMDFSKGVAELIRFGCMLEERVWEGFLVSGAKNRL